MSAPAGWHLQPDGRERFWDGTRWTEHFRAPAPADRGDPTAAPETAAWTSPGQEYGSAASVDPTAPATEPTADQPTAAPEQTQMLDVSSTQALPAQPSQPVADASSPYPPGYAAQAPGYGAPAAGYGAPPQGYGTPTTGYGAPTTGYGAPTSGYGAPGQQWPVQPPPKERSGLAAGCLVAAVFGLLLLVAAIIGGVIFVNRAVDQVNETLPSIFPSGLPTELPTDLPTGIPTEGLGDRIQLEVGDGFELPRATIDGGWSLESQGTGVPVFNIKGMKATVTGDGGFPVLFTMSFPTSDGGTVDTVCTASGNAGATVDVSCVPLFGDVSDATRATVTASL